MTSKTKAGIAVTILFAAVIITNPSVKQFKEYAGSNSYKGLRKETNFILFSRFINENTSQKYIGFFSNFFEIKERPKKDVLITTKADDGNGPKRDTYDSSAEITNDWLDSSAEVK